MDAIAKNEVSKHVERDEELASTVSLQLNIDIEKAVKLVKSADYLYKEKMTKRFTDLKFNERLKRTNPFLVRVRNLRTVREWATTQVTSALFASEEEAIGHVLEMIVKTCHPTAAEPETKDDLDFQVEYASEDGSNRKTIRGFQIKMSWDCMPMSSRKNLSNTIRKLKSQIDNEETGVEFEGVFAPCYGSATTRKVKSQDYITMRSRDLWSEVGLGDEDYDVKVGKVCAMLFGEFRGDLNDKLIPVLIERLTDEGLKTFGNADGTINYEKLFRAINR